MGSSMETQQPERQQVDAPDPDLKQYILSSQLISHPLTGRPGVSAYYHRELGGLVLLDSESQAFLQRFANPCEVDMQTVRAKDGPPEVRLLKQFILRQFLVPLDNPDIGTTLAAPMPKVNVVQLVLVNACNFGCTYCFEGMQGKDLERQRKMIPIKAAKAASEIKRDEGEVNLLNSLYSTVEREQHQLDPHNRLMRVEDAIDYVNKAIGVARATGAGEMMLQFFGGEPLLNWPAIKAVLETFRHGEHHHIKISYTIVTNVSLLTPEMAQAFHDWRVGVCVSFDSPDSLSRPLKNGKDSRPAVFDGLRLLQAHSVRVALNSALSTDTWDSLDASIVAFAKSYGVNEIGLIVSLDAGFYGKFGSERITERIWAIVEEGQRLGVVITGYWHQIFQLLRGFQVVQHRGFKNCAAKGAQLSIEPNGAVFSCKAGSGHFGSINDDQLLNSPTYRQHAALRQQNPAFCHGCEIEGFCAGLCLGPLQKKFDTVDAVEPAACDFYRKITRKFIQNQVPFKIATFDLAAARNELKTKAGSDTA